MIKGFITKYFRNSAVVGLMTAGLLLMTTQTALAVDNGGNANGKLAVLQESPLSTSSTNTPVTTLNVGNTYYFELENPGGHAQITNVKKQNVPQTLTFNFFPSSHNFHPQPGKWDVSDPTFTVKGTRVSGTQNDTYYYKVVFTTANLNGITDSDLNKQYVIEAGPLQMNPNSGEDEIYFTNDPTVGGSGSTTVVGYSLAGKLPEVPYAGILPVIVLLGGGYLYLRRRRKVAH